jgi:hypothetical protein
MKTFYAFVILTFIGLLFIGCSDKSIAPVETTGENNNNAVLQKVDEHGAMIIRHDEEMWWGFIDEQAGLMLILGVNDIENACAGTGGLDIINIKDIYLPNTDPDLRRLVALQKGKDFDAMVWETNAWPEDLCGFLDSELPLATGTANLIYTDNDFFAYLYNHSNTNSFGNKANGTLFDQSGQKYKLNLVYRIIWDNIEYNHYNEVFKVQLTRTGH